MEAHEHIGKPSWRNRTLILASNGSQAISIPVERPRGGKTFIKDVRISEHGSWRHVHEQALVSSYGNSPYFEYYWDDIKDFYKKRYTFLWDYNWELLHRLTALIGLNLDVVETDTYISTDNELRDERYSLHPKSWEQGQSLYDKPYYQVFSDRLGFVPNLSFLDLLMNMGPESLLYLHEYTAQ